MHIERLILGPLQTNCYLVSSNENSPCVLIIDPADEPQRLLARIGDRKISAVLLTHGHFDHIFGAQFLCDTYGLHPQLGSSDIPTYECAEMQMQMFLHRALPLQTPPVERGLEEGEEIHFGHQRINVINTPGHTPGGVCYYLEGAHLLLSGDSLFRYSIGRCDLPGSDGASLVRALQEKILALPDETLVLPGHGDATTIADERMGNPYL